MTRIPPEKYPAEGKPLEHDLAHRSRTPVTYSTETPALRRLWWRIRSAVKWSRRA